MADDFSMSGITGRDWLSNVSLPKVLSPHNVLTGYKTGYEKSADTCLAWIKTRLAKATAELATYSRMGDKDGVERVEIQVELLRKLKGDFERQCL